MLKKNLSINTYSIRDANRLIKANIKHTDNGYIYQVSLPPNSIIEKLELKIKKKMKRLKEKNIDSSLDNLVEHISSTIRKLLRNNEKIFLETGNGNIDHADKLIRLISYWVIGFNKISPFLLDDHVQEIYIDGPGKVIYLDHQIFGRISTNVYLSKEEIETFIFLLKIYANLFLTHEKPSDKVDLITKDFSLRISVDSYPIVNHFSIDIRKQNNPHKVFLKLVLSNNPFLLTIFLIFASMRKNILVIGEPGSGKTTLVSFLINLLPPSWRIITIEDTKEIQLVTDRNILRFRAQPFESRINKNLSKEEQILKLLHRSPDYVVIGEVQDKEDAKALMHTFSAGLKGIATTHSTNIRELLDRFVNIFNINYKRLNLIDLIVVMEKKLTQEINLKYIRSINIITKHGEISNIETKIPPNCGLEVIPFNDLSLLNIENYNVKKRPIYDLIECGKLLLQTIVEKDTPIHGELWNNFIGLFDLITKLHQEKDKRNVYEIIVGIQKYLEKFQIDENVKSARI